MTKRKVDDIDIDEVVESVDLSGGLVGGLLNLGRDELAAFIADIANKGAIPTATFKRARAALPSFSQVKWSNFAQHLGLPNDPSRLHLQSFVTPSYQLPPSLHEAMFENAWRWQDVYRERVDQTREEARVRILDPVRQANSGDLLCTNSQDMIQYIVPIVALFHGRVVDKPEQTMRETKYSTGGDVEHEVSIWFNLCTL